MEEIGAGAECGNDKDAEGGSQNASPGIGSAGGRGNRSIGMGVGRVGSGLARRTGAAYGYRSVRRKRYAYVCAL
jgi:hypothetical protein